MSNGAPRSEIELVAVTAGFLARVSNRLAAENAGFRMRITLGVVLIRSLVCFKCVPGRLRSVSGVAVESWIHEEVI